MQSVLSAANSAAAGPTMAVMAAGADEVSALIAGLFDAHAQAYQALSAQALVFHDQFVQMLNAGAGSYAAAEAANASPLQVVQNLGQNVLAAVNAAAQREPASASRPAAATVAMRGCSETAATADPASSAAPGAPAVRAAPWPESPALPAPADRPASRGPQP